MKKRIVTFSGRTPGDETNIAEASSQAAHIVALLEKTKLAAETRYTSGGAAEFAELIALLLSNYCYVPGRPGGRWLRADGDSGVWRTENTTTTLIVDASEAVRAYVQGPLTDRLNKINVLLAPKLTADLASTVRQRLLKIVKDILALRRRLENDLSFQSDVCLELERLLLDQSFDDNCDNVNVYAREGAVFLVDAVRHRLEPVRDRKSILELKLVNTASSLEPAESSNWVPPSSNGWKAAMQVLGYALVSGARPRQGYIRGTVGTPRIIQIVELAGSFGRALARVAGGYALTIDARRSSAPSKKQLLGKRILVIDGDELPSAQLIRGVLNGTAGNKTWPAIVVCSADRSPLVSKGQTVIYIDARQSAYAGSMAHELHSRLLEGFRSLGENNDTEFDTQAGPQLELVIDKAVREIVEAEIVESGVECVRPSKGVSEEGTPATRERVALLVERLKKRADKLGFLSLTIRQSSVVRSLKALGFTTSMATNRLFWWFRPATATIVDNNASSSRDKTIDAPRN